MAQVGLKPPIFGEFIIKRDDHSHSNPIGISSFSDAQISLIDYFASADFYHGSVHLSLYLIFYWYMSEKNNIFMHVFPDEQSYWKTMNKKLTKVFSCGSKFRYKDVMDSLLN
jgi:hypothetical protein